MALERARLKDINAKEQEKIWELQKQRTALEVEYTERKRWIEWDILRLKNELTKQNGSNNCTDRS